MTVLNEVKDKRERQRCQVFSRNNGYLQPVSNWNRGKKSEWKQRKVYKNPITE